MMEHDFYSLDDAAERIGCEVKDLLKRGAEGKVNLWGWYDGHITENREATMGRNVKQYMMIKDNDIMNIYLDGKTRIYSFKGADGDIFIPARHTVSVPLKALSITHETLTALLNETCKNLKNPTTRPGDEMADVLNPDHPWHSELLAIAVKGWLELYSNRPGNSSDNTHKPPGGNIAMIANWLSDQKSSLLTKTSTEYLGKVINPSKGGGPNKTQE